MDGLDQNHTENTKRPKRNAGMDATPAPKAGNAKGKGKRASAKLKAVKPSLRDIPAPEGALQDPPSVVGGEVESMKSSRSKGGVKEKLALDEDGNSG